MFYVYILQSEKDNNLYIGATTDLVRRINEHKTGKVKSTKHRRPLNLVCYEAYRSKRKSLAREKYLKSSDGKKDIYKRIDFTKE